MVAAERIRQAITLFARQPHGHLRLVEPVRPDDHGCPDCGTLLFRAEDSFFDDSGESCFSSPATPQRLTQQPDLSDGRRRVALHCAACDSHVGHVFPDGPFPTGLRYRVTPAALPFRARH